MKKEEKLVWLVSNYNYPKPKKLDLKLGCSYRHYSSKICSKTRWIVPEKNKNIESLQVIPER
jgi:hypothetical protein